MTTQNMNNKNSVKNLGSTSNIFVATLIMLIYNGETHTSLSILSITT